MRKTLSIIAIVTVFAMMLTASGCGRVEKAKEEDKSANGPEIVTERFINAFYTEDVGTVMDCIAPFADDFGGTFADEASLQDFFEVVSFSDDFLDAIQSIQQTKDDSDDLIDKIVEDYELSAKELKSIEEAAEVAVTLAIEIEGREMEISEKCLCIKIDGEWYIMNPGGIVM